METHLLLFAFLIFFSLPSQSAKVVNNYIVQLRPPENVDISNHKVMEGYYNSFLPNTSGNAGDKSRMIHTYQYAMCGFAARLTKDEVDEMAKKAGFLNARPSRVLNMLTTHTPSFLAIADGVDVMSISLGVDHQLPLYKDYIAIASFTAARKGIFVSGAAGNSGPLQATVVNVAPWVLTVAAGTMDRSLKALVKLRDNREFEGQSAFQPSEFSSIFLPLTYPILPGYKDNICLGNLTTIKGKVVLCHNNNAAGIDIGYNVHKHGGAAMILMNGENEGYTTLAEAHVLPVSNVNYADATKILSYFNSSTNATAAIMFQGTIVGKSEAPAVAFFSSRGPSVEIPGVLKPDILAPGVNIVAAWPFTVGPKPMALTNTGFNIIAGTSMATPHLSGIAALLKVLHPRWSPAAIKSAIMTTATTEDNYGKPILDENHHTANYFMMGAGQVNPSKAADPGLVFDIDTKDYIAFLCGMGYSDKQVGFITGDDTQCEKMEKILQSGLNYPSIITSRGQHVVVKRTVTNVVEETSTYKVEVDLPKEVAFKVVPNVLEFNKQDEKKSFVVSINSGAQLNESIFGNLKWVSKKYTVRMPIIVH
ncbi:hypothetical protein J5N97_021676 [Dioscorea zingiberensis]|uniref:Uncharacterized protein n=1 Tax=Dioscorea zingiberensis TaxID=325984 RepID=A0A9D5C9M0_9LILI|nr:hypothetical protein J5N97_021676 [Dioscorea zingiberensis]